MNAEPFGAEGRGEGEKNHNCHRVVGELSGLAVFRFEAAEKALHAVDHDQGEGDQAADCEPDRIAAAGGTNQQDDVGEDAPSGYVVDGSAGDRDMR